MGQNPVSVEEFSALWREFEAHAAELQTAEAEKSLLSLDGEHRHAMQRRFQKDAFVRALLIGMAETEREEG
jgi:hypothetical protein